MTTPGTCRVCGCTDDDCSGCIARTGSPCHWVEPDLCSACVDQSSPADRIFDILGPCRLVITVRLRPREPYMDISATHPTVAAAAGDIPRADVRAYHARRPERILRYRHGRHALRCDAGEVFKDWSAIQAAAAARPVAHKPSP